MSPVVVGKRVYVALFDWRQIVEVDMETLIGRRVA